MPTESVDMSPKGEKAAFLFGIVMIVVVLIGLHELKSQSVASAEPAASKTAVYILDVGAAGMNSERRMQILQEFLSNHSDEHLLSFTVDSRSSKGVPLTYIIAMEKK